MGKGGISTIIIFFYFISLDVIFFISEVMFVSIVDVLLLLFF